MLRIDRNARRDERRDHLASVLKDAVWGGTRVALPLRTVVGGMVRWHVERGSKDSINDAIETVVEAASLGLIRPARNGWKPGY